MARQPEQDTKAWQMGRARALIELKRARQAAVHVVLDPEVNEVARNQAIALIERLNRAKA